MGAEEEQLDLSKRMNAGTVESVVIGPMSAELVEVVAEEEVAQETVEADLRKYTSIKGLTKFLSEETDTKEEAVPDAVEVDQEMMEEGPES